MARVHQEAKITTKTVPIEYGRISTPDKFGNYQVMLDSSRPELSELQSLMKEKYSEWGCDQPYLKEGLIRCKAKKDDKKDLKISYKSGLTARENSFIKSGDKLKLRLKLKPHKYKGKKFLMCYLTEVKVMDLVEDSEVSDASEASLNSDDDEYSDTINQCLEE